MYINLQDGKKRIIISNMTADMTSNHLLEQLSDRDLLNAQRTIEVFKGLPKTFVAKSLSRPQVLFAVGDEPFFKVARKVLLEDTSSKKTPKA